MRNFNLQYIRLLRSQVEDEIKYLESVGHTDGLIENPCIFCYQAKHLGNKYYCNRLAELNSFLSRLRVKEKAVSRESSQPENSWGESVSPALHYNANSMRRPIGHPVSTSLYTPVIESSGLLPSMPVNFDF